LCDKLDLNLDLQIAFPLPLVRFTLSRNKKMPYEVLPASNGLINMIAASGFPADRFAIEYFPNPL
jgi:hypothetical protein